MAPPFSGRFESRWSDGGYDTNIWPRPHPPDADRAASLAFVLGREVQAVRKAGSRHPEGSAAVPALPEPAAPGPRSVIFPKFEFAGHSRYPVRWEPLNFE